MKPTVRINDLIDMHKNYSACAGCPLCEEIQSLRKSLDREPVERYKHILEKGRYMTKSDIAFLLENEVQRKVIMKALRMDSKIFFEMMRNFGLMKKGRG